MKFINALTTVSSNGTTKRVHIFLGASGRKTTANAVFMIHKMIRLDGRRLYEFPGGTDGRYFHQWAGVDRLKAVTANLTIDDTRVEEILRTHLKLPEELWNQFAYHDVYLTGADAVKYGMAEEIAEFSPAPGAKVLNALG